jgi:hypothetical protein
MLDLTHPIRRHATKLRQRKSLVDHRRFTKMRLNRGRSETSLDSETVLTFSERNKAKLRHRRHPRVALNAYG